MDRFKTTSDACFPGKIIDLWADFTFYCYDSEKVVEHLNKILNKDKEEVSDGTKS